MSALDPRIADALARLPDYLSGHVLVSIAALVLGLTISFPLAVLAADRPWLRSILLSATSIVQTIPGLALLALFYPLLLALAALSAEAFGWSFSAFGFLPAMLALALYSMLPVVRNTITGLLGLDTSITEACLGVGMTRGQALRMVELPLALPMIMGGVRTAAVWVIGTATLSTPIGQTSLGNYIFTGLQTQNWVFVLFGCAAAALLAIVVDQLLALMETGAQMRSRARVTFGALGLVLVVAAALAPTLARPRADYVIGAKPFAEQYILAALIGQRLENAGQSASLKEGLGSAVVFTALANNEIDVYVEYTGTLWANQMGRTDAEPRAVVLSEVTRWLKDTYGITMAGTLGFENSYALAMLDTRANAMGIRTMEDLARHAPELSIAGDYEFFGRPEWTALRDAYGLRFREERAMQAEFMYPAVASGDVDVISAYTSDGRVAKFGLTTIADDKQAIPPYDAILLIAPKRADDRVLRDALKPLTGAIDIKLMREANLRASDGGDSGTPAAVARWMWQRIQGR